MSKILETFDEREQSDVKELQGKLNEWLGEELTTDEIYDNLIAAMKWTTARVVIYIAIRAGMKLANMDVLRRVAEFQTSKKG